MYDPYVTEEITVRDLLCHRSGLKTFSGDLLWYGSDYSREEVLRKARFLKPVYGFRAHFGYSNIMYIAAGEVVEKISGKSWGDFLKDEFFIPLGMNRTNTSTNDLKNMKNVASCHTTDNDKVISIPYLNWDNVGPAGSINSCLADASQWIKLLLNRGTLNGKKYFSEGSCREMWTAHTSKSVSMGSERLWPSTHFKSYGMGWNLYDYHGKKIVAHSGGYDGMISQTVLIPEEKLGFIILTNKNSSLYYPLVFKILDAYLSKENKDWSKIILDFDKRNTEFEKKQKQIAEENRKKNTKPTFDLVEYTGIYECKMYGKAEVKIVNGELEVHLLPTPIFVGRLKHWHYDTFSIKMIKVPSLPDGLLNFTINENAEVEKMKIDIPNPDFDFTEMDFVKIE